MAVTISIYRGDRADFALYAKIGSADSTPVIGVDEGINALTLDGDRTNIVNPGDTILWTQPDTAFGVDTVSYNAGPGETVIATVEDISTATVGGYLLFPWNVRGDFEEVRAQARYEVFDEEPVQTWNSSDPSLDLQNGDGIGDKMVFRVPPDAFVEDFAADLMFEVEGVDAGGDVLTIVEKGQVTLSLSNDLVRV